MYVLWTAQNFAVLPGVQYPACVWRPVTSHSSHHPQAVLMAHFSLHVHKGGLKPHSFNFIYYTQQTGAQPILGQRRWRWANIKINIKIDQSTSKSQKFRLWWPDWRYISWFYKSLLQKTFGFNGTLLNWFHSYLNNRYQRVIIHGSMSTKLPVRCGVPQGSILGPLMFILYVNDIADNISNLSFKTLYMLMMQKLEDKLNQCRIV